MNDLAKYLPKLRSFKGRITEPNELQGLKIHLMQVEFYSNQKENDYSHLIPNIENRIKELEKYCSGVNDNETQLSLF